MTKKLLAIRNCFKTIFWATSFCFQNLPSATLRSVALLRTSNRASAEPKISSFHYPKIVLKQFLIFFAIIALATTSYAQIGGKRTFQFLDLPAGAKVAGIGGVNITSSDEDVTMFQGNPALLKSDLENRLAFTYNNYLGDISHHNLAYAFKAGKTGTWGASLNYLNYGDFIQRDETGLEQGTFSVKDYAFGITKSTTIDNYTLGATAKVAVSDIAGYSSVALLGDVGGTFTHPEQELVIGLLLKNIGYQVSTFSGTDREPMPFDAQIGVSYKLEHMPLRFSATAHHLQQFDIVYLDPNKKGRLDENSNEIKEKKTFADKLSRHFVFGGEFLLSKNLNARVGYNHLRRRELRLEEKSGGAGLSFGLMLRIRSFRLDYSRAYYHVAGAANYFTITTDFNYLFKKKEAATL